MLKMIDFGERRILAEIIPKFVPSAGDDCATLMAGDATIVVTTDPVPPPAATVIGKDTDPYWMGWLLVVINASDLAAAGASPLGFLSAIECPRDYPIPQFERLLSGIKDACENEGLSYCGGNLREAEKLAGVGTAIGWTPGRKPLQRSGGKPGDLVISIGAGGRFWRDAMLVRGGGDLDRASSPLFAPRSQLHLMQELAARNMIRASMDNSDGLLPSLQEIANKNNCIVDVDIEQIRQHNNIKDDDHIRYWMGWGDWNVIGVIDERNLSLAREVAVSCNSTITQMGSLKAGPPSVRLHRAGKYIPAPRLESERFARDSWFSEGIDGYIDRLQAIELP
jgi:thiamine-monophosphate kinase